MLLVERCIGEAELMRHQDRVGDLVELRAERIGRVLPLTSELRGIEPSGSCWRSNRNSVASRAVARSPAAINPVHASYRSRANTSRYEPK